MNAGARRALRFPGQDLGELRLDLERFAEANKEEQRQALELALAETKQWPDVQQAFNEAFTLYRQPKAGQPPGKSN